MGGEVGVKIGECLNVYFGKWLKEIMKNASTKDDGFLDCFPVKIFTVVIFDIFL